MFLGNGSLYKWLVKHNEQRESLLRALGLEADVAAYTNPAVASSFATQLGPAALGWNEKHARQDHEIIRPGDLVVEINGESTPSMFKDHLGHTPNDYLRDFNEDKAQGDELMDNLPH